MNMWPQVLVAGVLLLSVVLAFVRHGEIPNQSLDRGKMIAVTMWFALVLGAGGFWSPR